MTNEAPPLQGIRVLDLGRYQAGPRCALMLSRLGADVIKIERPGGEESRQHEPYVRGQSAYWVQYNSGKRSLGLDLYTEQGKEVLRKLVGVSDIFIQNFRPGTIAKMGFSYDVLKELNPRIIMVNVSAYGQYGPYKDRVGFDPIGQAISGHMMMTGSEGMPPIKTYFPVIDRITALHATIGALGALWERERSGEGQCIDVALADSGYSLMEIPITYFKGSGNVERRRGNGAGLDNAYQCTDGWIMMSGIGPGIWQRIAKAMERQDWLEDPRLASTEVRDPQRDALVEEEIREWFSHQSVRDSVERLSEHGVPIAPVNTVDQAAEDTHPWERDLLMEVPDPVAGSIHVSGNIMHYSRSALNIGPTPLPGEHTEEILGELLGMTQEDFASLREAKVI